MATKLYVSGLAFSVTDNTLQEGFARFGEISYAHVMIDGLGRSRGFGYVTYTDDQAAQAAVGEMNGTEFEGRVISVGVTSDDNPSTLGFNSVFGYMKILNLNLGTPPIYADNAAAKAGGLADGDVYRNATGLLYTVYT